MICFQRTRIAASAIVACLSTTACSDFTPGCGSDKAVDEVLRVIKNQAPTMQHIKIQQVHTLRTNFATGEVLCSAAVIKTDANANQERVSVGYNVYYDTQRRLAISVYGAPHQTLRTERGD
ncbi:hypothetical protein [Pseudidiomarina donghaiensis]|uniref:hypothetical protein n=1 Tax=Pseudidiomarina donghaiensis TaxID=519452 RepID=UPI0008EA4774|nr:hypothetical protein [Pseudidiomarina donghaiensis]SFV24685.1 hypothetical protein SAMN04488139_2404 [Pseudidiomarina donghaiensis]